MFERLSPLFPYLKRYRRQLATGAVVTVLYNASKITLPKIIGSAVDDMRLGVTRDKIFHHGLLLFGVAALSAVFLYLMRQIVIGASREIEFDLRNDLFENLLRQPPSFYHQHRTGDIMARTTNDLNAVRQLLGPAIMYSANTVVFTAAALPFMLKISPWVTLCAFVPLPIASVVVQYFGSRIHTRFERIQAMFSEISAKAQENFSGARFIRAFAQEEAEIASWETANQEYIRRSLLLVRLMAMLWPTLEFVLGFAMVITLLVGGHEVVKGHVSAGNFTAFAIIIVQLTWPMIALGWVVNLFQRGTASVVRIDELLKWVPLIDDSAVDSAIAADLKLRGDIEFRNLSFAYGSNAAVLHDITLTIPAGSSLAIVGPTGSGKSTLVHLIPRLLDAKGDQVLIDGVPIRHYPLDVLRSNIGFVPQETFLFSESIRENIAFGVQDATDEQIVHAATTAHIAKEIQEFPNGFDTVVGERGITLSGGQKQRTAIARALIREPRILILDDALASVDTYTEERILSGLKQEMQDRTTIFISHRVSTAANADQIAVLIDGRIAELGTHEELLMKGGYYTSLFEKQQLEEEIAVTA
ncbi:ABC transporter ATP-binding protein [Terriglobus sp. 2YAB30_2]|uniref:ABC transporter ATP-binding protein n=1 Tax=unclassified Terriglobus TaxID=2628988 RepID=UPI003F9E8603